MINNGLRVISFIWEILIGYIFIIRYNVMVFLGFKESIFVKI